MAEEFTRELDRCVDRLRAMPLAHLSQAAALAHTASAELLALGGGERALPHLADRAAGDQLAVIGADLAREHPELLAAATDVLTRLRRSLA